ncbi:MAG: efflux RND transporter permease subunit [Planctomycetota bacterium]|jgi:multidrug efflux pump subunit AcrB
MNLTEFSIRNKVLTYFIVALIAVGGIASFLQLGQLEDPDFTIKKAVVITPYPGASPQEVELEVTDRIEKAIQELPELKHLYSISRPGLSMIKVDIKQEYWSDTLPQVWDKMRSKIRDVTPQLPPGVGKPDISDDFNFVYGFVLALTGSGFSYKEMEDYADELKKELSVVKGVARVELWGVQDKVIYIDAAEKQLSERGITAENFIATLGRQNMVVDAGYMDAQQRRYRVAPTGEFSSPEDIADLYLHPTPLDLLNLPLAVSTPEAADITQPGQSARTRDLGAPQELIRIRDIAEVRSGYLEPPNSLMRFNGKPAIAIQLANVEGGNVVQTGRNIEKRLNEIMPHLPVGIEITKIAWQSDLVNTAINDFMINLIEAVAIVLVVLALPMGMRMGIIIGTGLVLTILATFILMAVFGIDLERMSLGALVIALGMMVDNSIVVADGIAVRLKQGMDRKKAAIEAASGPAMPLLGATIVAVMAFYPIFASVADAGEYCRTLFIVVAFSLLLSWLIAMTVTPIQCMQMLRVAKSSQGEEVADEYGGKFFTGYRKLLESAIRGRWLFMGAMIGLLLVSVMGFGGVRQMFFPDSSRPQLMVDFWFPEGTRIQEVSAQIKSTEKHLINDERVMNVSTFVGQGPPRFYLPVDPELPYQNYAELIVNTHSFKGIDPLIADLEPWMQANYPGAVTRVRKYGVGVSENWKLEWHISGPATADLKTLRDIGTRAVAILENSPYAKDIKTSMMNPVQKLVPEYDQVRGRWASVSREDIGRATRRAYDGVQVGLYREEDDLYPILLRHTKEERKSATEMDTLQVQPALYTKTVPLAQVTKDIRVEWEDPIINRWERRRCISIQASPKNTTYPSLKNHVIEAFNQLELPPGYEVFLDGQDESTIDAQSSLIPGVIPAVAIILTIIVALFNALRPPLIIILTIPFALIGVTAGLLPTGTPFGFMALLGAMSLAGMMIKNAIVLLDQVNIEQATGKSPYEAVVISGVSRLRPVVLAAATTVLGVMPLLQDVFWISMAVTIMAGLTFGTLLTMFVVPVLYTILFKVPSPKRT